MLSGWRGSPRVLPTDELEHAMMKREWTATLTIAAGVVALAACASTEPTAAQSQAYQEGWRLGCYSGYTNAGATNYWGLAHTPAKYADSPDFKPAWDAGYRKCFDWLLSGNPPWRTMPSDWEEEAEAPKASVE
jgi:hypothetical protein